jgi:FRG domain
MENMGEFGEEVRVSNWAELLTVLHSNSLIPQAEYAGGHHRSSYVFRGMSVSDWTLQTSLERIGSPPGKVEAPLLRAFSKYASPSAFPRTSEWDRLAVAQHNGLPTRVLDWTASPLIAAHFATCNRSLFNQDGVIWCINADMVRNELLPDDMRCDLRNSSAWVYDARLLDKIYPELSLFDTKYFDSEIMIFMEPPSIDSRIQNQFGLLSLMNGPAKSHHEFLRRMAPSYPYLVKRVVIEAAAKSEIRDMLDTNNINERMLFPGLPGLCDWLRRYYSPA